MNHQQIIDFWYVEVDPKQWWRQDDEFDHRIAERFGDVHVQAVQCELYAWRYQPLGRLAEIIVLDQFSRNIYRGTSQAFAADPLALALAQEAVAVETAAKLETHHRAFLYMPYMHSESRRIHEIAVELFSENGLESYLDFELRHKAIIDRFGRYPHRNKMLGRNSSEEESDFLKTPVSSF
jgi:uncharacterized protein (DUF924 family)